MNKRFGPTDGKWCKVEIMGHVEHIARACEVPLLDGKALRVCDEVESKPILYGLGAIFSLTWLTDEEGEKESARVAAEQARHEAAVARGAKIGGIQQKIREVVGESKMSKESIRREVCAALPGLQDADFEEAFDGAWLSCIYMQSGPDMWWLDPEDIPF